MNQPCRFLCSLFVSTALILPVSVLPAYADLVNGSFEDGTTGWTLLNYGSANAVALSSGTTVTSAGTINPSLTDDSYVYTSQTGAGRSILYQTFSVSSGSNKIFFDISIKNSAGAFSTPSSMDYSGAANQQAWFDILVGGSTITTMDPGDIIVTAYQTQIGDSADSDWVTVEVDLTDDLAAYTGQDVIIRYVQVDNQGYFNLALDNINVGQTQSGGSAYYFIPVSIGGSTGGTATVLDDILSGSASSNTNLSDAVSSLSLLSSSERAEALQRISPNTGIAMASVSNQVVQGGFSEIGGRLGAIRSFQTGGSPVTGVSSGNSYEEGSSFSNWYTPNSFWGQVYGFIGDQGQTGGYAGYESFSKSVMVGYDIIPAEKWIVGAAFGYANTNVNMQDYRIGDETDINSYQFSLYGSYALEEDWALDLVTSYARHEYESSRYTSSDIAYSEFGANHFGLRADVSHSINLPSNVTIIPKGGLEWTSLKQDSYSETNSVFAQAFDATTTYRFNSNLSIEARKEYKTDDGYTFVPNMRLGWKHQFRTAGTSSTSSFVGGGDSFTTQGQSSESNSFNIKAGTEVFSDGDFKVDVAFDGDFAKDYRGYGAQLQVKWKF